MTTALDVAELLGQRYHFISSTADQLGQRGVGILIKKQLTHCISSTRNVSNRILSVTLTGNQRIIIVTEYAAEAASSEAKDNLYNGLPSFLVSIP